jgi:hypothetical protein
MIEGNVNSSESDNFETYGTEEKMAEDMGARFPKGTFARIAAILNPTEDRTDFVREAVERELQRREAEQKGKKKKKGG